MIEAVSHQSGAPQPATNLIGYVPRYQKRMFNNRTFAALSFMAFFFGASSLINQFPPSILEFVTSATFFLVGYLSFRTYRRMSPPPEKPFMDV